jgi:SAM-dependent methyltransferase
MPIDSKLGQPEESPSACVTGPWPAEPVEHWRRVAKLWDQVGPPLRPCGEDIDFLTRRVHHWASAAAWPPRALILGVTPEICRLSWPLGAEVHAIDHTPSMIDAIWPGPREAVTCGEWTDPPFGDASFDLVFCDGGLHLMRNPCEHDAFARSMRRILAPGGLFLLRLFAPADPPQHEEVATVIDDLLNARIANLNLLKFRLWMAMHSTPSAGVPLREVWNIVYDAAPDFDALADRIGWEREHLAAIDSYRDSPNSYHFLTVDDAVKLFSGEGCGFVADETFRPSYPMGNQCPWLTFRRFAKGASGL